MIIIVTHCRHICKKSDFLKSSGSWVPDDISGVPLLEKKAVFVCDILNSCLGIVVQRILHLKGVGKVHMVYSSLTCEMRRWKGGGEIRIVHTVGGRKIEVTTSIGRAMVVRGLI